jgi:phosphatidylinositol alpha-1,6-mannosyltransferase
MSKAHKKIVLLTLKTFSAMGGIERVNRVLMKTCSDVIPQAERYFSASSLYDDQADEHYMKGAFRGFKGNRIGFMLNSLYHSFFADTIILTHINLSFPGLLIKLLNPRCKIILMVHGIEVWRRLSGIQEALLKKADVIIAVSHYTRQRLLELHTLDEKKIRVLNHCLDPVLSLPHEFTRNETLAGRWNISAENRVIFTLARLSSEEQYKGYDTVIRLLPELLRSFPSLVYVIAGKYDEAEKQRLEHLAALHKVSAHLRITGFVPEEALRDYFSLADVFVMPSREEGFGLVYLEAMAHGVPVIAGNADGSVDALQQGRLGTLVDPGNEASLSDAITRVLSDLHITKGAALQQEVLQAFGYEKYKEAWKHYLAD